VVPIAVGDPHTRNDEEAVFVPSSFDLGGMSVTGKLALWCRGRCICRAAQGRDIEDLLLDELKLQRGAINVIVHQPEPFLIQFKRKEDYDKAQSRGRFQHRGIDICLQHWRSLTHTLGYASSTASAYTWTASPATPGRRTLWSASSASGVPSNASTLTLYSHRT
jgi:hypothetical protein